ncbi:MAG TPA: YlmC/YmxH family sporulation protein [Candidatus Avamphibacillus intestinigallinarum]|nr:YlmC/YmxH family sporulation protein [Candidatus Avamphibacillus intestinigallinarum]
MVTLSELQKKEIVTTAEGKRLGYIVDVELDPELGKVIALIVFEREQGALLRKAEERVIQWEEIVTIGEDIILIQE